MINILLLKDYNGNKKGDIISVSNNVAFGLEESGVGKQAPVKAFEKKVEFGGSAKTFTQSPSKPKKKQ